MILCDNIVFELQAVGGVSKYWAKNIELLDKADLPICFLEGPGVLGNVFRRGLQLHHPVQADSGALALRRFRGPAAAAEVFHSSYYRVSRKARRNVVTIHDFMNEIYPSGWRDPVLAKIKKRSSRQADRIVVVSHRTRQDLLRFYPGIDPDRVEVLYNGVDAEFFHDPQPEGIVAGGLRLQASGYFLYVGTRGHCKNFPYVLQILKTARQMGIDVPLIAVGGGAFREQEKAAIEAAELPEGSILQLHGVETTALRHLYSNCLALLIPSLYEGFGLPAAEAARCGALVLTARGSALDEITGETEFAFDLKEPGDIRRVLALDPYGFAAQAERARLQQRSQMFSWEASAARLGEIYAELAND